MVIIGGAAGGMVIIGAGMVMGGMEMVGAGAAAAALGAVVKVPTLMGPTLIIAQKEIKEIMGNSGTLLTGLAFSVFFAFSRGFVSLQPQASQPVLDSTIFFLAPAIGLFMAYINAAQVFMVEKRDRIIETLLCSPVTLRQVWLGKVLGVTFYPYLLGILTSLMVVGIGTFFAGHVLVPGRQMIFYVLVVVPVFIAAYSGIMGFSQLLLGMRENRIVNFALFVPSFAVLYGVGISIAGPGGVSTTQIGLFLAGSLAVLLITAWLGRFLSKERIVTTIS